MIGSYFKKKSGFIPYSQQSQQKKQNASFCLQVKIDIDIAKEFYFTERMWTEQVKWNMWL